MTGCAESAINIPFHTTPRAPFRTGMRGYGEAACSALDSFVAGPRIRGRASAGLKTAAHGGLEAQPAQSPLCLHRTLLRTADMVCFTGAGWGSQPAARGLRPFKRAGTVGGWSGALRGGGTLWAPNLMDVSCTKLNSSGIAEWRCSHS